MQTETIILCVSRRDPESPTDGMRYCELSIDSELFFRLPKPTRATVLLNHIEDLRKQLDRTEAQKK